MRRYLLPSLVTLAAVALIGLLAFGVAGQDSNGSLDAAVAKGRRPPAPSQLTALPRLDGPGRTSLRDLRGKVVLLNVFASWCDPCKAEAPLLEQAQRQLLAHGGTVLGVTYLDNSSDSERFMRQERLSYPVIRDVSGGFVRSFGATGVPETFVIDRTGRVAALRRFQLDSRWLSDTLIPILARRT
ncbi:MAG TPA: TlpA disulfide reductase family protein [Solirubrobacteraceae bacterium]|nr:TlpA disulfide reductase family protein [Solirubrobacteraceae bacterium]